MNEQQALSKMIAPGTKRPTKYRQGVIQIWLTRSCDKSCFGCTQGSNLGGNPGMMTPAQFEIALQSLEGYWGVVGIFGGNPALSPHFETMCLLLQKYFPKEQRGLWCNNPMGKGKIMRQTFDPSISNLNVHLDEKAYYEFRRDWPESRPFGLTQDSMHSPSGGLAMKDLIEDESVRWDYISDCDINKHWSAMIGVFRNEVRAWFCEVAGAQAMLHQHEPDYPDTSIDPRHGYCIPSPSAQGLHILKEPFGVGVKWWELPMHAFKHQVRKHCHECAVPLKIEGELACAKVGVELTSKTHESIFKPKRKDRAVVVVTTAEQLKMNAVKRFTDYLGNANRGNAIGRK